MQPYLAIQTTTLMGFFSHWIKALLGILKYVHDFAKPRH